MGLSTLQGQVATTFVDASGSVPTAGTFVQAWAASGASMVAAGFRRISNNNAAGSLLVYDKVGTATLANSFILMPGQSYSWDVRNTNSAILVTSSANAMTYEGCQG